MKEALVGLNVVDKDEYLIYRKKMTPILKSYGGSFRYDFRVSETLKSATNEQINRVFVICFPDGGSQKSFFQDSEYLTIKREHFERSVSSTTIM